MTMPGTISKLVVKNVMKVKYVVIEPDPDDPIVLVKGENGNGKTSVLNAIRFATAGKNSHPPRVIREGESEAFVEYETPELQVVRKWDAASKSTTLEVRELGEKKKSAQAVLDGFFSDVAMEVESFMALTGPERRALLSKATGVDTSMLDREEEKVFEARTVTGRDLKAAQARLAAHSQTEQPPAKVDTAALLKERGALTNTQQAERQAKAERDAAMRRISDCQEAVRVCEQALVQAKTRLEAATKQAAEADNATDDAEEKATGCAARISELDQQLQKASAIAGAHARWEERCRLAAEVEALQVKHDAQDKRIADVRSQVEQIIAAAKFPVPGLSFAPGGVSFKGLPFEQASQAEQLRCSVGIAVALNPKLRVILIRQGSLFDKKSMRLLRELCREYGMQAWVEAVGDEGPATIIMVDGEAAS